MRFFVTSVILFHIVSKRCVRAANKNACVQIRTLYAQQHCNNLINKVERGKRFKIKVKAMHS